MQEGITPIHLAAQYGHFEVCQYICNNAFVAPPRRDRNTPLTLALHRGHIKIARYLHERDSLWPRDDWLMFKIILLFLFFITVNYKFGKGLTFADTLQDIGYFISDLPCPLYLHFKSEICISLIQKKSMCITVHSRFSDTFGLSENCH